MLRCTVSTYEKKNDRRHVSRGRDPEELSRFRTDMDPPVNIKGRGSVAIRESDRINSLTVLSDKKLPAAICKFNRSESLTQSTSQRFIHRWQRAREENEDKKGWGHKGIKAERGRSTDADRVTRAFAF
ncbi:hypothetical protein Tcan_06887 [Toxocara canis]|uniref:Uncharacterized protein n=1 Tax=Toxocara canis TaxID=6265 RepID=A0A0B2V428_TOXCA|nr:hypothetical protein Tcan_06887 [Toxocara canis]